MVLYIFDREGFLKDVANLLVEKKVSFTVAKELVSEELNRLHCLVEKYATA